MIAMAPLNPDLYRIDNQELADRLRRASSQTKRPADRPEGPLPVVVELWTHEIGHIENLLRDDHAQLLSRYCSRLDACPDCGAREHECECVLSTQDVEFICTLYQFFSRPRIGYSQARVTEREDGIEIKLRPRRRRDVRELVSSFRVLAWIAAELVAREDGVDTTRYAPNEASTTASRLLPEAK